MRLGIPGQIVALLPDQPDLATVNVSEVKRDINIAMLDHEMVKPGDWVLIHVGFAMAKMDEEQARASLGFLEEMGQAFTDAIRALENSQFEWCIYTIAADPRRSPPCVSSTSLETPGKPRRWPHESSRYVSNAVITSS